MTKLALVALLLTLLVVAPGCSRKKEVRTVGMGEKAEIGPLSYHAMETRWPMTLEGRTPKERFFIVNISVLNSGGTEVNIPAFEIVDDDGNSYPELADGTGVEQWLGITRRLSVANTDHGNIVFDAPPKHYRLRVADENDNFMYIDIPLNLSTEDPTTKKIDGITK
jgi:hypothetical protein